MVLLRRPQADASAAPCPRQRRNPDLVYLDAHAPHMRAACVVSRTQLPVNQPEFDPVACTGTGRTPRERQSLLANEMLPVAGTHGVPTLRRSPGWRSLARIPGERPSGPTSIVGPLDCALGVEKQQRRDRPP